MDLISLYYFSELAKDLHMTRTANRLFISQQTLSNHIKRLEDSLDVQLFQRKPVFQLTYAGEKVLSFANVVNSEYANLKDLLSDIGQQERGVIRFGASYLRMNTCLPDILPEFSGRYPHVELRLTEANSPSLEPMVMSGELDFAIVISEQDNPSLFHQHLLHEPVYLCVADSLLRQYYGEKTDEMKFRAAHGVSVTDFSKLPFCLHSNRLGRHILNCFDAAGVVPNTYIMSSDTQISLTMCMQRRAACFVTQMRLIQQQDELPEDINLFPLYSNGQPMTQHLTLVYRKDRYLSRYSKLFLDLIIKYFSDIEQVRMEHTV